MISHAYNFQQMLAKRDIYLLRMSPESGVPCWFYLRLRPEKRLALEAAMRARSVDCAAYGEVLASGYGNDPPSHVRWAVEGA